MCECVCKREVAIAQRKHSNSPVLQVCIKKRTGLSLATFHSDNEIKWEVNTCRLLWRLLVTVSRSVNAGGFDALIAQVRHHSLLVVRLGSRQTEI